MLACRNCFITGGVAPVRDGTSSEMGVEWKDCRRHGLTLLLVLLLLCCSSSSSSSGRVSAWPSGSVTRFYHFKVETTTITKLCVTSAIVTVNGMFPGPAIHANQDDRLVVKVTNLTPHNVSIHWHGVRQRRTCWFDGPAYVTQCPIQPSRTFTYRFALLNQKGTLFWHAHISWLRATVHGPLIVYPKIGFPYPFEKPQEEHVIVIADYWLEGAQHLENRIRLSGDGPPGCDAYLLNGHPGPLHNCSTNDMYTLNVEEGRSHLLRIINAALNMEHFFVIADHTMTVVEADGEYTSPFQTPFLMITPGQTYSVLVTADRPAGSYYMAVGPYMPSEGVPFLKTLTYGLLNYSDRHSATGPATRTPELPSWPDTSSAEAFAGRVRSLLAKGYHWPVDVPSTVDKELFLAIGLNVFRCRSTPDRCQGPAGGVFAASMNNVTFRKPEVALLQAYYQNLEGYYTTDFPDRPNGSSTYDFVRGSPNEIAVDTEAVVGTRVSVLEYGWSVQLVFQDTGTVGVENHPIHLHGHSFYVLGSGIGNYDAATAELNLVDPPFRNTIGVPTGGWAVVRFRADNPGVWFMHCHLEVHTTWGLSMAFLVNDGKEEMQRLPPPPPDLPSC